MQDISVQGITKSFGSNTILTDVFFSIIPGEILGLIGPNGAGKTTLLECLAGLSAVQAGTVTSNNKPIALCDRKKILWYQPDDVLPFSQQQVSTTLSFFRKIHCRSDAACTQLVHRLDLFDVLCKPIQALSKGYKRRVLLAIALLSRQPLLLLDEPFDGFDLRLSLLVMDLLRDYRIDRTMLLSIHQLSEAEKICDRFLLLDQGHVLGIGTLDELRTLTALSSSATLEDVFLAITC